MALVTSFPFTDHYSGFGLKIVGGALYLQVKLAEKTYRRLGEQGGLLTGPDVPAAGICDLIQRMNVV